MKPADGVTFIQGSNEHEGHEDEHAGENSEEQAEEETPEDSQDSEAAHDDLDPHIWLDPVRAITIAENIKQALD